MRVEDPMLSIVATRLRLETGESLCGEGLHRLPAALRLVDFRDELQNSGVIMMFLISCMIGYPFLPIFTRFRGWASELSISIHFDPFISQKEALVLPLFSY
jgi:hypothetical protein